MASYFQSYFQSSSMPKRLLQYALFRLNIFDTETLDLDSLDIAWGKKCVFEFKNVGLRLKKIESLLQLPSSFETVKACVLLLRLTIPVDIYSSPIVVEVDGVECQLRFRESSASQTSRRGHQDQRHPTSPTSRKYRSSSHILAGKQNDNGDQAGSTLPSAVDLAESFLQAEPEEEKVGLEAAILTESPEIGNSYASLEEGDNDTPLGTGTALSLPTFMATFLTGIMDRLQVRIRGVTLGLDVEIPSEISRPPSSTSVESVTVQLQVDDIDIEGVTHDPENLPVGGDTASRFPLKKGKRLIRLSKIRGDLISEAETFTSRARTSSISSPSTTHSDFSDGKIPPLKTPPDRRKNAPKSYDAASSIGGLSRASSSNISARSLPHDADFASSLQGSVVASDFGRFDDAPEDEYGSRLENPGFMEQSVATENVSQRSRNLDQFTDEQYSQHIEQEGDNSIHSSLADSYRSNAALGSHSSNLITSNLDQSPQRMQGERDLHDSRAASERTTDSLLQSSILPTRQHSRFSRGRVSQSQSSLPERATSPPASVARPLPSGLDQTQSISQIQNEDDSATPDTDDLAESQMFSHEDAESMYMSAASYGPLSDKGPEGWTRSSVNSGDRPAAIDSESNDLHANGSEDGHLTTPIEGPSNLPSEDSPSPSTPLVPEKSEVNLSSQRTTTPEQNLAASQAPKNASRHSSSISGYDKIAKHIFNIDKVAIYLPGAANESSAEPASKDATLDSTIYTQSDGSHSTLMNIPGAFSTHLPAQHKPKAPEPPLLQPEPQAAENVDNTVEVQVGRVAAHVDMSVGTLIWTLLSRLKSVLTPDSATTGQNKPTPSLSGDEKFKFGADNISVKFLERVEGFIPAMSSGSDSLPKSDLASTDVLLQSSIDGLCIDSRLSNASSQTSVTIRKFTFGYAKDNIVSFDASLQLRASVRDLKASAGIDVSLDIHRSAEFTRFDIKTLPLQVSIDLQRLDETFSWFGGLSSVLNLGSSIASNTTITATSPSKRKGHGVHFEVPISPDDKSLSSQSKADIRIGGFMLSLIGTECSIMAETSAIKMVSRDEGIGVGIQKIKLSGPHLKNVMEDPVVEMELTATRLEYLPAPKDVDLDTLLSLITPSKAKYDEDDDILLDTLLRQRKQGGVLRLSVENFQTRVSELEKIRSLPGLLEEISKLSTVAKYLPDDDRPGLLSLVKLNHLDAQLDVGHKFGVLKLAAHSVEIAHVTLPALAAFSINSISIHRNITEELVGPATDPELREPRSRSPAIMARMIGDEMEPVVKIKLWNLKFEYRVPTLMAALDLAEDLSLKDDYKNMATSVATLTDLARSTVLGLALDEGRRGKKPSSPSKPVTIDVILRDCICGLNPLGATSKVLVVLTETHLSATLPKDNECSATADMNKGSILVIDDIATIKTGSRPTKPRRQSFDGGSSQVADLCGMGFVSISYISSAKAIVLVSADEDGDQSINVELRDDLFVLETCADSTQTLIAVLNALTPPSPPSKDIKYRTKVIPVEDLLASLSGDAFGTAEGDYNFDDDFDVPEELGGEELGDFDIDSRYYQPAADQYETLFDDEAASSASTQVTTRDTRDGVLLDSVVESEDTVGDDDLEFEENHFGASSIIDGTAHRWNSTKNTYDRSNTNKVKKSPLKVCVRQVHIIWNLFDGYDWQHTRDTISRAVQDVESKAIEKRSRYERRPAFEQDIDDTETVIGDFLFNSIYIGIPANRDPRELTAAINLELNDNATETESVATTSVSASPNRQGSSRTSSKHLRLKRSKHHKITFELKGACADFVAFPAGSGETQNSLDVRVHDFEIFDHVPTSTWRKFATYMQDAGERETGTSMIHLEILNVKPIPDLAASEMVVKATVLPLRLHVDQDALDFITRFFEFKDDTTPANPTRGEDPFFQRVEVNSVQVKLDFKPKRVDYAGLRSGHTTEFMNFLILDEADMVLRHTIIYGVSGAEKLGKTLNDIWMPDIKRNQLPGILAGLAPVRSIVNVGGGLRHLVLVPMREYQKDGRIVRSLSKGAAAFAKTTGTELVKLGAKVAIGVQTVLQGAEGLLSPPAEAASRVGMEDDGENEETKQISLYANQPVGVLQGLRGGYDGLQRDLLLARDAIIAVPGEVMDSGNAAGVLRAVRKHAPTVILRPAIGVAKAGGQVLMGATNALDPANIRRAEAKYKRH